MIRQGRERGREASLGTKVVSTLPRQYNKGRKVELSLSAWYWWVRIWPERVSLGRGSAKLRTGGAEEVPDGVVVVEPRRAHLRGCRSKK
jgi:hypothetical protein